MKRCREKGRAVWSLLEEYLDNTMEVSSLPPENSKLFCGFRELMSGLTKTATWEARCLAELETEE